MVVTGIERRNAKKPRRGTGGLPESYLGDGRRLGGGRDGNRGF